MSQSVQFPQIPITPNAQNAATPAVGIVIVNYNCLSDTVRCLRSLAGLDYPNYFVVLVDNASPDGSGEALKDYDQQGVRVVCNPENKGFAAGNNVGIHHARLLEAEYVWLLNPDTEVAPNALSELVAVAEQDPQVAATGSKILYGEDDESTTARIWGAGGIVDAKRRQIEMRGNNAVDEGQFDEIDDCGYLPGCSMLVRSSVVSEVGYLPEEYFMYFEETDWCQQMRNSNYLLRYVPKSVVYHHFSDDKMQTAFTVYYYNRNNRLFWSRYSASRLRIFGATLFRDLPRAMRALVAAQTPEQRRLFFAHAKSCFDFLFGRFGKRRV